MVSSTNGKITLGDDPYISKWTSDEDKAHFRKILKEAPVIIMGRKTYQAARRVIQPSRGKLRIVTTSSPDRFQAEAIDNQLEFVNESPSKLVARLKHKGHKSAYLMGGAMLNRAFFKENLVDELWLTLEPKLFGEGKNLIGENEQLELDLVLLSCEKLNQEGTLLLKYKIKND